MIVVHLFTAKSECPPGNMTRFGCGVGLFRGVLDIANTAKKHGPRPVSACHTPAEPCGWKGVARGITTLHCTAHTVMPSTPNAPELMIASSVTPASGKEAYRLALDPASGSSLRRMRGSSSFLPLPYTSSRGLCALL